MGRGGMLGKIYAAVRCHGNATRLAQRCTVQLGQNRLDVHGPAVKAGLIQGGRTQQIQAPLGAESDGSDRAFGGKYRSQAGAVLPDANDLVAVHRGIQPAVPEGDTDWILIRGQIQGAGLGAPGGGQGHGLGHRGVRLGGRCHRVQEQIPDIGYQAADQQYTGGHLKAVHQGVPLLGHLAAHLLLSALGLFLCLIGPAHPAAYPGNNRGAKQDQADTEKQHEFPKT